VVLVHDAFGLTDDMREQADWLAVAGYLVAIPDLYGGKSAVRCDRASSRN
jgi:carboxymethylenebutenolidase